MNNQTSLLAAINDQSGEKLEQFARNEVLYASFEQNEIEYRIADGIIYEESVVMPSKFEPKLWYYVQPHMMGHKVVVGSNYFDIARERDDERINERPFGSADRTDVCVLFRSSAHIDTHATVLDSEVIITERPDSE